MPVSAGLQKYFDAQGKGKKGDISAKLKKLQGHIDPAFIKSFQDFHDRILEIVDENEDAIQTVAQELDNVDMKLQNANRRHNMKKASAIIKASQ